MLNTIQCASNMSIYLLSSTCSHTTESYDISRCSNCYNLSKKSWDKSLNLRLLCCLCCNFEPPTHHCIYICISIRQPCLSDVTQRALSNCRTSQHSGPRSPSSSVASSLLAIAVLCCVLRNRASVLPQCSYPEASTVHANSNDPRSDWIVY